VNRFEYENSFDIIAETESYFNIFGCDDLMVIHVWPWKIELLELFNDICFDYRF